MNTVVYIVVAVLCIVLVWCSDLFRFLKTLVLIVRVRPYQRYIKDAPTILILGDSTGYGTGAHTSTDTVAGRISIDFPKYSIKNNSKNGRTIGELLPVVKNIGGEYKLILLQIGGNDILQKRDVRIVEQELREIVRELSKHSRNLIMISSGNVGGAVRFSKDKANEYEQITRKFRGMFTAVATETELVYVDLFLEPEVDIFILEPKKYFSIDGLHPSSEGYVSWYERLLPILKKILEKV